MSNFPYFLQTGLIAVYVWRGFIICTWELLSQTQRWAPSCFSTTGAVKPFSRCRGVTTLLPGTYFEGRTSWKGLTNNSNNELVLLHFPLSQWYKYLPFKWGKQVLLSTCSVPELAASRQHSKIITAAFWRGHCCCSVLSVPCNPVQLQRWIHSPATSLCYKQREQMVGTGKNSQTWVSGTVMDLKRGWWSWDKYTAS